MMISSIPGGDRVRTLNAASPGQGPVVYWMGRDQRTQDNWALLFAQGLAVRQGVPLCVAFCLSPRFLDATLDAYRFMGRGLEEVRGELAKKRIPFFLLSGQPPAELAAFVSRIGAGTIVTDFDPLRVRRGWKDAFLNRCRVACFEVDAHNIVPCWMASPKQDYAAYTFRPKIHRLLPAFLTPLPKLKTHPHPFPGRGLDHGPDVDMATAGLSVRPRLATHHACTPGEAAARARLRSFVREGLVRYTEDRNNPVRQGQSGLSPYLHFGQISAQRVALEIQGADVSTEARNAFLEELIVRRELSDNYVFYNEAYDRIEGIPPWARATLDAHRGDRRARLYSVAQLEAGETHDALWNAAQMEMVKTARMHGYLRMYWAKKILEWSPSPEDALAAAIYLNDTYELDGRDPNGYAGILWSIGGVHDRAWPERPIFGKIRYMSEGGCRSKFRVAEYIRQVNNR